MDWDPYVAIVVLDTTSRTPVQWVSSTFFQQTILVSSYPLVLPLVLFLKLHAV